MGGSPGAGQLDADREAGTARDEERHAPPTPSASTMGWLLWASALHALRAAPAHRRCLMWGTPPGTHWSACREMPVLAASLMMATSLRPAWKSRASFTLSESISPLSGRARI